MLNLFIQIILFIIIGTAPTTTKINSTTNDKLQFSRLCYNEQFNNTPNEVFLSSEYFQGMNHEPTIRHICRGSYEIFYLEMTGENDNSMYYGELVSRNSAVRILSKNIEPKLKLLESNDKNKIKFTVDNQLFIYDEYNDKFAGFELLNKE